MTAPTKEEMSELAPDKVRTDIGGVAYSDDEYNRRWLKRLMERTEFTPKGCFEWQGPVTPKGYIMITHRNWRTAGHRIVYMLTHKVEIETEAFVCHACDNRRCWNPGHLFIGSAKANNNDCATKGRHHNAVKTVCKQGHPFDEENTYFKVLRTGSVARGCKTCDREKSKKPSYIEWRREYQRRKRAEKRAALQPEVIK